MVVIMDTIMDAVLDILNILTLKEFIIVSKSILYWILMWQTVQTVTGTSVRKRLVECFI